MKTFIRYEKCKLIITSDLLSCVSYYQNIVILKEFSYPFLMVLKNGIPLFVNVIFC